jgi:short-subunit dehydrogenase
MKLDGCSALITGASVGIGREFARQLGRRAVTIVLVARRRQRLEELRDELMRQNRDLNVHVRVTDLADKVQVYALIEWLEREKIAIDLLINNAGLGDLGPFAASDLGRLEQIILVNMLAPTLLTRRLLPSMIANKHGAILNVSSSAGFLPIAEFSVYAASKAYLTNFSEGLRAELGRAGVTVCTLCPGPVHTEFDEVAHRATYPHRGSPEFVHVSAERVARAGLLGIEHERALVIPGLMMKIGMFLVRMTPMWILRLRSRFSGTQG